MTGKVSVLPNKQRTKKRTNFTSTELTITSRRTRDSVSCLCFCLCLYLSRPLSLTILNLGSCFLMNWFICAMSSIPNSAARGLYSSFLFGYFSKYSPIGICLFVRPSDAIGGFVGQGCGNDTHNTTTDYQTGGVEKESVMGMTSVASSLSHQKLPTLAQSPSATVLTDYSGRKQWSDKMRAQQGQQQGSQHTTRNIDRFACVGAARRLP